MDGSIINDTFYEQILNGTKNFSNFEIINEDELLYDPPVEVIVLLSVFYGVISILAVLGNSLVIWIVATTRQMQTITNFFIANLAFADVIIGMFAIPFEFQAALLQRWNLPEFMCPFCPFIQLLSVNVSVFTLTAIAVDRHRAILNPLRARPSKCIAKIIISTIWILSLLLACPVAFAMRVKHVKSIIEHDGIKRLHLNPFCDNENLSVREMLIYRYILGFVQYVVPLCVISFVYIQMALKLWGSKTPGNAQNARDITLLKNKKKVIKMLIVVVFLFALCWLPLQTYNILQVTWSLINEYPYINIIWFCSNFFAMSNSCYNPFIYAIYNEKFKREYRRRFPFGRWLGYGDYKTTGVSGCTDYGYGDKTTSMHTRASSVRSNYPTSSIRIKHESISLNKSSRDSNIAIQMRKTTSTKVATSSPTSDAAELSSTNTTYKCNCFTQSSKSDIDVTATKNKKSQKLANAKKNQNSENNQTKNVNYCDNCQCHHNWKLSSIKYRKANGSFTGCARGKGTCDMESDCARKLEDNEELIEQNVKHHDDCIFFMKSDESETLM